MEFGREVGKPARGMAKEGMMGEDRGSRVGEMFVGEGDRRGEGGRWEVEVEIEFRGFEFRSREGCLVQMWNIP